MRRFSNSGPLSVWLFGHEHLFKQGKRFYQIRRLTVPRVLFYLLINLHPLCTETWHKLWGLWLHRNIQNDTKKTPLNAIKKKVVADWSAENTWSFICMPSGECGRKLLQVCRWCLLPWWLNFGNFRRCLFSIFTSNWESLRPRFGSA